MKKYLILNLALLMSLTACGGDAPSTTAACEAGVAVGCNRAYECLTVDEIIDQGLPPTEAECVTQLVAPTAADCASADEDNACGIRETYHPEMVDACLAATQAATCADYLDPDGRDDTSDDPLFPECDAVCTTN